MSEMKATKKSIQLAVRATAIMAAVQAVGCGRNLGTALAFRLLTKMIEATDHLGEDSVAVHAMVTPEWMMEQEKVVVEEQQAELAKNLLSTAALKGVH